MKIGRLRGGSSACISLNWKTPNSCKDTEYLNNTATVASLWECQPCPKGKFLSSVGGVVLYSFRIVCSNHFSSFFLQGVIALAQSWQPTFHPNLDGGKYLVKKGRQHLQTHLRNASTPPPVPETLTNIPSMPRVRCNWAFATLPVCANRVRRGIPERVNRRVCRAAHQRRTTVQLQSLRLPCWAFSSCSLC